MGPSWSVSQPRYVHSLESTILDAIFRAGAGSVSVQSDRLGDFLLEYCFPATGENVSMEVAAYRPISSIRDIRQGFSLISDR